MPSERRLSCLQLWDAAWLVPFVNKEMAKKTKKKEKKLAVPTHKLLKFLSKDHDEPSSSDSHQRSAG